MAINLVIKKNNIQKHKIIKRLFYYGTMAIANSICMLTECPQKRLEKERRRSGKGKLSLISRNYQPVIKTQEQFQ